MRQRFETAGWVLFLFSSFGFLVDTTLARSVWGFLGSALFFFGVVAFLLPMVLQRGAQAPNESEAAGQPDGLLAELAELVDDRQPSFYPADDAAVDVNDVPEPQL